MSWGCGQLCSGSPLSTRSIYDVEITLEGNANTSQVKQNEFYHFLLPILWANKITRFFNHQYHQKKLMDLSNFFYGNTSDLREAAVPGYIVS